MSFTQFGDGTTFGTGEAGAAPLEPQPIAPLQPIPPLNQVSPAAPEVAAPVPTEPAPGVPVADMRDVPLGTLVFRAGLLPEERLEEALQEGMKTGRRLGEILLERGWVSEDNLGRLLAAQKGLPFVELDSAAIDPTAPPLLHPEKARLHGALPIGFQDGVPVVAVADPSNDLVVENVRRALACEPFFVVAGRDALARMIEQVYGSSVEGDASAAPVSLGEAEGVTPAVEQPAPVSEQPVAPSAEPAAPVAQPMAPAGEPAAAVPPPAPVEPAAPATEAPVAPPAAEPVPPAFAEPPVAQAAPNGGGLWLGETASEPLQQPVQAAEPVQPVEPVVPVTPAEPTTPVEQTARVEPPQAVTPQPEPEFAAPEPSLAEPVASAPPEPEREAAATWSVVLRLTDGERIEVAAYATEVEAMEGARSVVGQIAADSGWPFFAGRFLRPDTIVSVDLVHEDGDRWLGSSSRAAAWTPQQPAG